MAQRWKQRLGKISWKRSALLPAYIVLLAIIGTHKDELLDWMQNGGVSPAVMLVVVTGFACIPVIPFSVVIATMGFLYGSVSGAAMSLLGAWLAALIMYGLFRYLFRGGVRRLLGRYKATERWTETVERMPFRSVLIARMLPVVPQPAVNAYAAALPIAFLTYAGASLLGKIPAMLAFAFIGDRLGGDRDSLLGAIGIYAAFLLAVYAGNRIWSKRGGKAK